jgi:GT2 family glycosyltransferase
LLYPDNTIYHAGVILGFCGTAGHVFRRLRPSTFTYFGLADWPRNYLALTGACLAVETAKFDQVGGFDEKLHTGGSDVVFGITLYKTGYRNVYWPFARLLHYEDRSGGGYGSASDDQHNVAESIKSYWPYLEHGDPYYNPNLDLTDPQAEQIKLGGLG